MMKYLFLPAKTRKIQIGVFSDTLHLLWPLLINGKRDFFLTIILIYQPALYQNQFSGKRLRVNQGCQNQCLAILVPFLSVFLCVMLLIKEVSRPSLPLVQCQSSHFWSSSRAPPKKNSYATFRLVTILTDGLTKSIEIKIISWSH